ncbi:MAG: response regulator [Candidatus Melainabacteria bacterium]
MNTPDASDYRAADTPVRVLLVDDHPVLREGMARLLASDGTVTVAGQAGDGQEAVLQALTLKPDVVLMDMNMPRVNGYEASKAILAAWPQANILILTNQDHPSVIRPVTALPVRGVLLKDVELPELMKAIHAAARGADTPLHSELAAKLKEDAARAGNARDKLTQLTDREKEVLQALGRGFSNQQLAEQFVVSPKTIHNHLYNIYQKIGVVSRSEAIVWAMESGLLDH